ncbi:hypothetical protein QAD02_015486 [Eretmocerus hayati]|uniref:Uncharacterized protein n=1 Tax=Eretmocerus hayati TaxID=131215 RepID=A0ACC2PAU5_9HYME|nr:hypothetical protein QAD02_015486 [Eretmocerus hayati]
MGLKPVPFSQRGKSYKITSTHKKDATTPTNQDRVDKWKSRAALRGPPNWIRESIKSGAVISVSVSVPLVAKPLAEIEREYTNDDSCHSVVRFTPQSTELARAVTPAWNSLADGDGCVLMHPIAYITRYILRDCSSPSILSVEPVNALPSIPLL